MSGRPYSRDPDNRRHQSTGRKGSWSEYFFGDSSYYGRDAGGGLLELLTAPFYTTEPAHRPHAVDYDSENEEEEMEYRRVARLQNRMPGWSALEDGPNAMSGLQYPPSNRPIIVTGPTQPINQSRSWRGPENVTQPSRKRSVSPPRDRRTSTRRVQSDADLRQAIQASLVQDVQQRPGSGIYMDGRYPAQGGNLGVPSTSNRPAARPPRTIFFYERTDPHYGFTNFSPHEVEYDGKVYPTSEHLFQALKFLKNRPLIAERIRTVGPQPRMALNEAHRYASDVRKDWFDVNIRMMDRVLRHKFSQHRELRRELLSTGDDYLVEDAGANDAFWGNGADGRGRNELGKALMRLRTAYRQRQRRP
ncbi:hypothetical protein FRB93_002978 [Tulasnella sp. JGI-2019a]|nr:hypothetical protein FRB93_002978 [Tulasnella sp. JGI-2019a]